MKMEQTHEMHDTEQKSMEFFSFYNQNRMIKTKNVKNLVKNMDFVVNLLTSVIELNNLLRYTTLEYLNANDRNMAIITFYMRYIHRYIDTSTRILFFCLQTLYIHGLRSQLTKLCCLCV